MLGVLDRERMELEDVAEDLEVVGVRLVEVEPEELAAGEQLSTVSRLKCTSPLPSSWTTWQTEGPVRSAVAAGGPPGALSAIASSAGDSSPTP